MYDVGERLNGQQCKQSREIMINKNSGKECLWITGNSGGETGARIVIC